MHDTHPGCLKCRHRQNSLGFVPGVGPLNAEVVIILETPARNEVREGRPAVGVTGGALNHYLRQAGLTRLDVRIENAVACWPLEFIPCPMCMSDGMLGGDACPHCEGRGKAYATIGNRDFKGANPDLAQIGECVRRHLQGNLDKLPNVRLFVVLGNAALYAMTGKRGIHKHRGTVTQTTRGPVLATFHPAYVAKQRLTLKSLVEQDFARIPQLLGWIPDPTPATPVDYVRQTTHQQVLWLRQQPEVVVDLETDSKDQTKLLVHAATHEPYKAYNITNAQLPILMEGLSEVVGQNFGNFDAWSLYKNRIRVPERIIDTLLISHFINPSTPNDLVTIQSLWAKDVIGEYWKTAEHYGESKALVALRDVDATKRSLIGMRAQLQKEGRWHVVEENIIPLTWIGHEMRIEGIAIDPAVLDTEAARLEQRVKWAGKAFEAMGLTLPKKGKTGLPSTQGMQNFVYTKLMLPVQKTFDGKVTMDKTAVLALIDYCDKHGLTDEGKFMRAYQKAGQMASEARNFRKYSKWGNRIHAEMCLGKMDDGSEQGGTVTGRTSYRRPSLHQVPKFVRHGFKADRGCRLLQCDVKQGEYMVAAYHAREFLLLKRALIEGMDFHQVTIDSLGLPRKLAKNFNFSYFFGANAENSAARYGVTPEKAIEMFGQMDQLVPGWKKHCQREIEMANELGYVQTDFAWRRYFDELKPTEIVNTRIQSDLALTVRYKLVDLHRALPKHSCLKLSVHDSILIQTPDDEDYFQETLRVAQEVMTQPVPQLPCPEIGMGDGLRFTFDWEHGYDWGTLVAI